MATAMHCQGLVCYDNDFNIKWRYKNIPIGIKTSVEINNILVFISYGSSLHRCQKLMINKSKLNKLKRIYQILISISIKNEWI